MYLFNAHVWPTSFTISIFLYYYQPSVFAVCKTWLSDHHYNSEVIPSDRNNCKDRGSHGGGGIPLSIDDSLPVTKLTFPSDLENLTVLEINGSITISVVYFSPSSHFSYFVSLSSIYSW